MRSSYYCLAFIAFMLMIKEGMGLNCYQCDSSVDPDCKEQFDWANFDTLTVHSTPCSVDQAKYCIKTTGVWGGVVGTQRFCSSRDMFNQCQYVTYADHNRIYRACIYTCRSDNCNTAPTTAAATCTLLLLLCAALAVVFLRKT